MQVCLKCGKAVKYIATGFNTAEVCDVERIEIVSETGRILKGYMRHVCATERQDKHNGGK